MALPVTIPNTFANATAAIPLSQLDANFNTLSNAVNGLNSGSETLANLKATTANVVTLTVTGNATIGDASTDTVTLNSTLTANTAVIFSAGTSAAPSITFTGDTNTGIFSPAADTIAFTEGGVEAMRIASDGKVYIGGTTAGTFGLKVFAASDVAEFVATDAGANGAQIQLFHDSASPAANDVTSLINFAGRDSGGNGTIYSRISGIATSVTDTSESGAIAFSTRNTGTFAERMRITSAGEVLVGGTTSINSNEGCITLQRTGSAQSVLSLFRNDTSIVSGDGLGYVGWYAPDTTSNTPTLHAYVQAVASGTHAAGDNPTDLVFGTTPDGTETVTERMRINSEGNVGIGVTPSAWSTANSVRAVQLNSGSFWTYSNSAIFLSQGLYFNGTNRIYTITGEAIAEYGINSGVHIWSTASSGTSGNTATLTERARITSGGYFKASSTGSYISSTGAYHEFRTDNSSLYVSTASGSQTSDNIVSRSARSANSAYRIFAGESNDGSDVEFNLRGDGNAYADGTWNNNGADYAEFFESANGQALTLGATVVLDGNKVREATAQDPTSAIIGVVRPKEPSKASMVVGNTAWNKWANKYLTDDFDRYIMEDHDVVEWTDEDGKSHSYESHNVPEGITVPADAVRKTHDEKGNKFQHYKLNPAWDKDSEYTPREQRPEWNIIGLVGQVKVFKGQPTNDRWVKMRDVSANVEEWFIR